jgi:hypothetical protein
MATIEAITLADFPTTFDQHVWALKDASKALEGWARRSAGKARFADFEAESGDMKKALETLAQSEESCDEAYDTCEKVLHDFLTELREFGEREFGGVGLRFARSDRRRAAKLPAPFSLVREFGRQVRSVIHRRAFELSQRFERGAHLGDETSLFPRRKMAALREPRDVCVLAIKGKASVAVAHNHGAERLIDTRARQWFTIAVTVAERGEPYRDRIRRGW